MLRLLADGYRPFEIAEKLGRSRQTICQRAHRAAAKIGAATVWHAIRILAERGYFKE